MRKEYKPDDKFKRWARALQFAYREDVLKDFNEYRALLTEKGNESFKTITYENYFDMLDCYSNNEKVLDWVKYLRKRYLGVQ